MGNSEWGMGKEHVPNYQFPIANYLLPIPNSQFPVNN
nr:alpha/beta hydrolase [Hassalia byssoidea]